MLPKVPSPTLKVIIHQWVLDAAMDHSASCIDEVGGFLLGEFDKTSNLVRVTRVLKARHTVATPWSITFTAETWIDARQQLKDSSSGQKMVGWYHSHPSFSAFLSPMDRDFHGGCFSHISWSVALILSPACQERRLFVWQDHAVVPWDFEIRDI